MLLNDSEICLFHHLVKSFSIESVEEPDSLEILNNIWNFVLMPPFFPCVVFSKVYHHESVIFFKKFFSFKVAVDIDLPAGEPRSFNILESQVFEVHLLNHFLIVADLILSLHNLGIGLKSCLIILNFSMAQSPDIHDVGGYSFVLFCGVINIELITWIVILRHYNLFELFALLFFFITFPVFNGRQSRVGFSFGDRFFHFFDLLLLTLVSLVHLGFEFFDAPFLGIFNVLDSLLISFEFQAAKG